MSEIKSTKYAGVKESTLKNGTVSFLVTFKYNNKRYPSKNFTKLFGCRTAKQAFDKLAEVKVEISQGNNPFNKKSSKVEDLVEDYLKSKKAGYYKMSIGFYNKHIHDIIGHLFIGKVEPSHIEKIVSIMKKDALKSASIIKVRTILNPVFEKAFLEGQIPRNVLRLVKFEPETSLKKVLVYRLDSKMKDTVPIIYKSIMNVKKPNYRAMFLISLMCARRAGEILQLKLSDFNFKNNTITARSETTKTGIYEKYPMPKEVKKIVQGLKDPLFTEHRSTFTKNYRKMIEASKIKVASDEKITSHDNRNFFMSICTMHGKYRSELVDLVLSHKSKNISAVYTSYEPSEIDEVYQYYWKLLRGKDLVLSAEE